MNNEFSTAEAGQCLKPSSPAKAGNSPPKRRVGSGVIYSSLFVPSPGRWKLTHLLTHTDLETYCWVFLTNQMSWSKSSCILCPSAFCTSPCPLSLWNSMWTHATAVPKPSLLLPLWPVILLCASLPDGVRSRFPQIWIIATNEKTTLSWRWCQLWNYKCN